MKNTCSEAAIIRYLEIFINQERRKYRSFNEIGRFAVSINFKVNQLINILHYDKRPDVFEIERALLKRGTDSIIEFSQQFRPHTTSGQQSF